MTHSRDPRPADQRLLDLAAELAPAKSLARLEAATGRIVTTVSVVATLLTGFGLLAAGRVLSGGLPRVLAIGSVGFAVLALILAVSAQVLSIRRGLNLDNLVEVDEWWRQRFEARAPRIRLASILLLIATVLAGGAAVVALVAEVPGDPVVSVTRTSELTADTPVEESLSTVVVDARFPGLDPGDTASVTVSVAGVVVAEAAVGPDADGVATRTLTVQHLATDDEVTVTARGGDVSCTGELRPGEPARVTC